MFPQLGTSAYGEGYDSSAATAMSTTLTRADGDVPNSENPRPPALLCCQGGLLRTCQRTSTPQGQIPLGVVIQKLNQGIPAYVKYMHGRH